MRNAMEQYPFTVRNLTEEEGGDFLCEFPDISKVLGDGKTATAVIGAARTRSVPTLWHCARRAAARFQNQAPPADARIGMSLLFVCMVMLCRAHEVAAAEIVSLPSCTAPSLTRPVDEMQISIQNSYPMLSTILGEEGDSIVSFVVNASGTVSNVTVAQSSGSIRLDEAAMEAVKQLIYAAAKANGSPVACRNEMRIKWHLAPESSEQRQSREFMNFIQPPKSAWPTAVLAAGKEGATGISVRVDSKGAIVQATMFKSSDIQDLDAAALTYVKGLPFKPAQIEATPASAAVPVVVIWSKLPFKLPVAGN